MVVAMAQHGISMVTEDGLALSGRSWAPSAPKAVVLLVHGLGEHSGRYDHVAEAFNEAGVALLAFDLRGHGLSEGKRGHAPNYNRLMSDIALGTEHAKQQVPNHPFFLYGHSLGGNLVLHYLLERQPELAGAIITSPLLRLATDPPTWQTAAINLLNALHLRIGMASGLDDTALSRDTNVVRTYRNDPLTHNRITPALANDMVVAGEWMLGHAAELPCQTLLMHGDADRITSPEATQEFAQKAGGSVSLRMWEGFFHELHNEPGKREVLAHITGWLENCLKD